MIEDQTTFTTTLSTYLILGDHFTLLARAQLIQAKRTSKSQPIGSVQRQSVSISTETTAAYIYSEIQRLCLAHYWTFGRAESEAGLRATATAYHIAFVRADYVILTRGRTIASKMGDRQHGAARCRGQMWG